MIRQLLLSFALTASLAQAQVSYTGGVYSQNFDTLPGTANNTLNSTWTDNTTLPGWYSNKTTYSITDGTVGGTAATFDATSAANNVGLFSFGAAAATDRALGSRATSQIAGNDPVLHGVRLVNGTSQTLTRFTVTYTGEQWFASTQSAAHTLLMDYQFGASAISTGTWAPVTAGTFTAPISTGTTARSLSGNTTANRTVKVAVVTGVSWAPGQELWIRFRDANESGNEQGLAVDDFSFLADDETALFFNGSTSYVTMGFGTTAASLNASSFTVECRFMRTGPGVTASTGTGGATTALPLVAKGVGEAEGTSVDANYFLGIDNATGRLVADFEQFNATNNGTAYAAGQNFPAFGSTVLQNGVFYHAAATYDTTTATWKLYLNGVAETVTQTIPTFVGVVPRSDNTQGFGIGTTINSTGARAGFFQGIIDEVRVWNMARTGADILANKDVKIAAGTPGLLGRYGFDENTGTTTAGINAAGAAAPVGTLAGTSLPAWINSKTFIPNIAPTVSITAPASGSSVMFPAAINLAADAADSDGTIVKVEFFNGVTKIGEDLTAPYTFAWTGSAVGGPYSITAVATDNGGGTATSAAVTVSVTPNSNLPPVVTLNTPADNATGIGSITSLSLSIADPEGDAQTVNFFGRLTTPADPGADFSLIQVPDTQYYSENTARNPSTTGNPAIDTGAVAGIYNAQMQWIVDNRTARNIAFVSHMGDIAQNGDAFESEWIVASTAQARIENPATTLRAHGIPWGVAPGNHDQMPVADAGGVTNFYTKYFNFTRWDNRPYYGGHFGTKPIVSGGPQFPANTNNYQLFSASGLDFIIIHLEYDARAKSFYQGVLDWADSVLKAYPNRRAIVTSHGILNTGNPGAFFAQGQNIYDDLKDNPNLFLTLCGHTQGEGRRTDIFQSRSVHSVLSDYQEGKNGGNGFLRILTFKPSTNQIHVESYSPTLNRAVDATDSIPQWTAAYDLNYNMQGAVTDWIPLGSVNVPATGTTASLNWTGLEAGKNYEWYATVNDNINTVTTATRRFSTTTPMAPVVTLTSPVDAASFGVPLTLNLSATASDADGTIARVEFFNGGTKIGEATAEPFTYAWANVPPGNYAITAVATDNTGLDAISSVANITVSNATPTIAITAPADASTFDSPTPVVITVNAADADGSITKVEFFAGAMKIGENSAAPYGFTWSTAITGSYALTAKVTDDFGAFATSAPISISVTNIDNVTPSVALSSPANGATIIANAVNLSATVSDTDGTVSKVEFYQGATKLGEDLTAPFSYVWSSVAPGTYSLTAVATDNDGGSATSTANNITVLAPGSFVTSYIETFDTIGTGTAPPARWSFYGVFGGSNATFTDSIPITGTAVGGTSTLNNTLTALTTFTTSSNTAGFNYALPASPTDRALGTSPTTGQFVALQLSLTNASGASISSLRIGYDIRRFTAPASANELPGYWLFYSLDNGVTWTNVAALNPTLANVPNTIGVSTISPTTITLGNSWNNGADILFRWIDDNAVATSPDQIHGLDNVAVTLPVGSPPTVALTAPSDGSIYVTPAAVDLIATASDAEGPVSKVEFYQGATKLGESLTAPFAFTWNGVTTGTYNLTAVATDSDANSTTSSPISITVNANAGSGTLTRGPYLNQGNHNSIVVRWRTTQPVFGRVNYGTAVGTLNQVANESVARTDHVVQLTGLTPLTRYYYSIGSPTDTLTPEAADTTSVRTAAYTIPTPTDADYTFRTSPVPGTATNTRVWIVGDCGRGSASQAGGRDAYYNWMGNRVPDLNLQLGDNAYNAGTDTEYQSGYWLMYPTIFRKMPQWSTLGNHDANNGNTDPTQNWPYFDMFTFPKNGECGGVASGTEHYYSFDYGNIHFVCLDSQTTLANSSSTAPQSVWLQQDLASTTKTWIIAFFHHPPYSKGSHNSDSEAQMITMRQVYNPIMEAGGVDLVLTGHSHNYERSVLLDGHYGITTTITPTMKKNAGNGSTTGFTTGPNGVIRNAANGFTAIATVNGTVIAPDGAYIKPLTGPRDHFGAVYNTAGMSGQADGGTLDHSAMYISYNSVGTVNLDINGNTLVATFIQSGGTAPDNYTIIKQGAADTDGDGVADEFEIANGMNRYSSADASLDNDFDGLDALTEYLFGLQPGVSDRYPWTTSPIHPTTGNIDVTFPTLADRKYQVFWSTDLAIWNPASALVIGDGTTKVWTDDGSITGNTPGSTPDKKRFYKVEVRSAP